MKNATCTRRVAQFLPAAVLLASFNGFAQQPTTSYGLHPVLMPGTIIAGHIMGPGTLIGNAVIADNGQIAFTTVWPDSDKTGSAVFTLQRRVAGSGDVTDGRAIEFVPLTARLAINALGQVAYSALYTGGGESEGIFIEKRPAFDLRGPALPPATPFSLSDAGQVMTAAPAPHMVCAPAPAQQTQSQPKPSIWADMRTHLAIPIPGLGSTTVNVGGTMPPSGSPAPKPNPQQSAQVCTESPLTMLSSNKQGLIVITGNTSAGPYILVGTPAH